MAAAQMKGHEDGKHTMVGFYRLQLYIVFEEASVDELE